MVRRVVVVLVFGLPLFSGRKEKWERRAGKGHERDHHACSPSHSRKATSTSTPTSLQEERIRMRLRMDTGNKKRLAIRAQLARS